MTAAVLDVWWAKTSTVAQIRKKSLWRHLTTVGVLPYCPLLTGLNVPTADNLSAYATRHCIFRSAFCALPETWVQAVCAGRNTYRLSATRWDIPDCLILTCDVGIMHVSSMIMIAYIGSVQSISWSTWNVLSSLVNILPFFFLYLPQLTMWCDHAASSVSIDSSSSALFLLRFNHIFLLAYNISIKSYIF